MRHGSRALPLLLLALACTFARADHPAEDGFVDADGQRNGLIGVSRSLGDVALPPPHCAAPSVRYVPLDPARPQTLVVASDGLWDVVGRDEVAGILRKAAADAAAAGDCGLAALAAALRDEAFSRGTSDNVTVAVIKVGGKK